MTTMSRRAHKPPVMPFGKHRGERLADVARDIDYVDWLLDQLWFDKRYAEIANLFRSDPLLVGVRELEGERALLAEEKSCALLAAQCAEAEERAARWKQDWLDRHKVKYEPRGIMPFGKYQGRSLAVLARDEFYCRWFKRTAYAKMNPELAADLRAAVETVAAGKIAMSAVELHAGRHTYISLRSGTQH